MLGHHEGRGSGHAITSKCQARTVDGDGNRLGENEAVLALEGGDLAQRVSLEVLDARLGRIGIDEVQLNVVGLSNRLDGSAAGVVLRGAGKLALRLFEK
jgi:hypothetical protein